MKTIYKYSLALNDWVSIYMPQGAKPLHVEMQNGTPQLWAQVDTEEPLVSHSFRIAGTGHKLGEVGQHIGSFMLNGGALVFHVFSEAAR
jgi:hypothetical protein